MPLLLALLLLLLAAAPARAAWAPAQPVSSPRDPRPAPVVGAGGHVVHRDGRRVVLVSPGGGRRVLGRSRRPYEQAGVDARGNVLVLYTVRIRRPDGRGSTRGVEVQRLSRRGRVSRPRRLSSFAFHPTLAVDARGRAVAAWVRDLPANRFAIAAAAGSTRRGLRRLGRVSTSGGRALRPRAAIGPHRAAMVAFAQDGRLRVARRDDGRFRAPEDVGPASGFGRPNIALAIGRDGDAVAAWGLQVFSGPVFSDSGDEGSPVYAAVRRDGRWGEPQELPGRLLLRTEDPQAVMAADGTALVGWVSAPGYEQPASPRVAVAPPGLSAFGPAQDLDEPRDAREIAVSATRDGVLHAAWVREQSVQVASRGPLGLFGPGGAVHEAPAHELDMRGGRMAFAAPAGVHRARYEP